MKSQVELNQKSIKVSDVLIYTDNSNSERWEVTELFEGGFEAKNEFDESCNLNAMPEIMHLFRGVLSEIVNEKNGFKSFEHVSHIRFLPKKLLVGQELTNLQKIKRNVVHSKYEKLIESMYQGHHANHS
jgi:long-subunit acyl-CoA synthetase (AMP-forming)